MTYLNSSAPVLSQVETALPAAPVPQPRLVKAAHEFEAAMMKELMAPMLPGHGGLEGGDDSSSSSALNSFAGDELGQALSERGGFGIARSIIRQLTPVGNHSGNSPVPKKTTPASTNAPFK